MIRFASISMILLGSTMLGSVALADEILLRGSAIVLKDCKVLTIRGGYVNFSAPGGRRMQRLLDDVSAIVFDGIQELDSAEEAMLEEKYEQATWWYILAMAKAENDVQRKWIHARLAKSHSILGHYVQAAGHAAAVFAMEDHPDWKSLVPVRTSSDLHEVPYVVIKEAYDHLQLARRKVTSRELDRLIDEMIRQIKPLRDAKAKDWKGPRLRSGSTISGYSMTDLDRLRTSLVEQESVHGVVVLESDAPNRMERQPATENNVEGGGASRRIESSSNPDDLERQLQKGQFRIALSHCTRRLEKATGDDAARLWWLKGRSQLGLKQVDEAAVSFTRGALMHPDSPIAGACLLETALIYLKTYDQPLKAERLLELALTRAEAQGDDMIASRARELLRP